MKVLHIIGCGGIGGNLSRLLSKQYRETHRVIGEDPDIVEEKNIKRQFFNPKEIRRAKVDVLQERGYLSEGVEQHFSRISKIHPDTECLFCCADNKKARVESLEAADYNRVPVIITGNEVYSAEAYVYLPAWLKDRYKDPRRFYPELLVDTDGISCADSEDTQTVMANAAAATMAIYLFDLWASGHWQPDPNRVRHLRFDRNEIKGKK